MTFNSKEQQIIKWSSQNGKTRAETEQALIRYRATGSPSQEPQEIAKEPSFLQDLGGDIKETAIGIKEQVMGAGEQISETLADEKRTIPERIVGAGSQLFKGVSRTFGEAFLGAGKAILPQEGFISEESVKNVATDFVEKVVDTETAKSLITGYNNLSPAQKQGVDDALGFGEGLLDLVTLTGASKLKAPILNKAKELIESGKELGARGISKITPQAIKNLKPTEFLQKFRPSEVVENTQNYLSRKNVGENFEQSIKRLTPEEPLAKYNEFFEQEMKFKGDIKQDTAIGVVGERIGNSYDKVVALRREVGNKMGEEIKKIGDIKVSLEDAFPKLEQTLFDSGVTIRGNKAVLSNTSKITSQEKKIIEQYINELNRLGATPTAGQLDAFLSRMPTEIDIFKAKNNVTKVTNGERIIKGSLADLRNGLSPTKNPLFTDYFNARTDYASLSKFLDEGASFLGKKTQAGDFAKDASLAKSSVQSILNQGKKDWLLVLEDLTGYQALDESVLALQAMQDAGNFRGSSLLNLLTEGSRVPTSAKDIPTKVIEFGAKQAGKKFAGSPTEQTIRTIESILSR